MKLLKLAFILFTINTVNIPAQQYQYPGGYTDMTHGKNTINSIQIIVAKNIYRQGNLLMWDPE
jgi:hypothetical protein